MVNSGKRYVAQLALQDDGELRRPCVLQKCAGRAVVFYLLPCSLLSSVCCKPPNKALMFWMQVCIAVTELKTTLAKMPAREFSCLRKQKWRLLMVSSRGVRPSPCLKILSGNVFLKAPSRFTLESQSTLPPQLVLMGLSCIAALKQTLQHAG